MCKSTVVLSVLWCMNGNSANVVSSSGYSYLLLLLQVVRMHLCLYRPLLASRTPLRRFYERRISSISGASMIISHLVGYKRRKDVIKGERTGNKRREEKTRKTESDCT